ncbi:hypothetical protein B7463_g4985, partial [Scytalidium lignicola]
MAPRRKRRDEPAAVTSDEEAIDQSSQDAIDSEMMKTAQEMLISSKRRKDSRRKAIENEYQGRIKKAGAEVTALFEKRKIKVKEVQKTQWQKLEELNTKREHLESLIIKSIMTIEQATLNLSREITAIFSGRMQEIKELPVLDLGA